MVPVWQIETFMFHAGEQGFTWEIDFQPWPWWRAARRLWQVWRADGVRAVRLTHNTRGGRTIVHTFGNPTQSA